jgi:addiction module HigA family antidote
MLPTHRPPTHLGEMLLREFLDPLGVSQAEAARRMNIPFQRLNAIIKGRRAVSADTALLLEALTRWDAQIWLTLQAKWDLWHALRVRGRRPKVKALPRLTAEAGGVSGSNTRPSGGLPRSSSSCRRAGGAARLA